MIVRPPALLLVEDNPADVFLLQEAITAEGPVPELLVAVDGAVALDLLLALVSEGDLPSLVLMDINMPRMNGFELLERIRSAPELHHLPVIMLTTSSTRADINRAYSLGANSFLIKPSTFHDFVQLADSLKKFWLGLASLPQISRHR